MTALTKQVLPSSLHAADSIQAIKLADTEFADDIALRTHTISEAQNLLISVEEATQMVGLNINVSKTKYLTANLVGEEPHTRTSKDGHALEEVDDFFYLGA